MNLCEFWDLMVLKLLMVLRYMVLFVFGFFLALVSLGHLTYQLHYLCYGSGYRHVCQHTSGPSLFLIIALVFVGPTLNKHFQFRPNKW